MARVAKNLNSGLTRTNPATIYSGRTDGLNKGISDHKTIWAGLFKA